MILEEIKEKAGSLSRYGFYIIVSFLMYLVDIVLFKTQLVLQNVSLQSTLSLLYSLVIATLLSAGVFGGMLLQQRSQDLSSLSGFMQGIKLHYWRIILSQLLSIVIFGVVVAAFSATTGSKTLVLFGINFMYVLQVLYSALTLFWVAAMVVERNLFRSWQSALSLFLFNPYALLIGVAYGALRLVDGLLPDSALIKQAPLAIYLLPALIYSVLKILIIAYSLAIYRQANGEGPEAAGVAAEPEPVSATAGSGLAKTAFGFAFVAFLPLVHLVSLVLGIMALKRKKQFMLNAAIACLVGGFFTVFYGLIVAGFIVRGALPAKTPGYGFLSAANASLQPQVALLEQGLFQKARLQLEQDSTAGPARAWTLDGALGIAAFNDGFLPDRKASLEYFFNAAAKNPDRAEFYYYYGRALLYDGQVDKAGEEFKTALRLNPTFTAAQKYLDLLNTSFYPTPLIVALLTVVILLLSFTVHEYGHAFAAWKLGDDTAKNLGRLTLNPLAHLDLFGSIILPGIMLVQQTGMVFGWAKPVPVDPRNFRNPRKDHMLVAFAGPATNLLIALASFILLGLLMLVVRLFWPETISLNLADPYKAVSIVGPPFARVLVIIVLFIKQIFYTSLVLGCLNLLPFPPLDGSWILSGLLPGRFEIFFEKIRGFGSIIFLLLVVSPVFDYLLAIPMLTAWFGFEILFKALGG